MANAIWPPGIEQDVETPGLGGQDPDTIVEQAMEAGTPLRDRSMRGGEIEIVSCTVWIKVTDKDTFDTFYRTTLKWGVLPFDWKHPVTQAPATFEFMPGGRRFGMVSGNLMSYALKLRQVA